MKKSLYIIPAIVTFLLIVSAQTDRVVKAANETCYVIDGSTYTCPQGCCGPVDFSTTCTPDCTDEEPPPSTPPPSTPTPGPGDGNGEVSKVMELCKSTTYFTTHPRVCGFQKIKEALSDIDITRTVTDSLGSAMTDYPLMIATNVNADEMAGCGAYFTSKMGAGAMDVRRGGAGSTGAQEVSEDLCESFRGETSTPSHRVNRIDGSLMGIALTATDFAVKAPIPMNLAYYFDDVVENTIIINKTAFAQGRKTYMLPGAEAILEFWKFTRNVAYAMLSIVFVVIGIMIMMRKKINPQTVVTAQSALPKAVIGAILIAFSYPIGATMTQFIFLLTKVALGSIVKIFGTAVASTNAVAWGILIPVMFYIITSQGAGMVMVFLAVVSILISIVVAIICMIKGILIYIRMIIMTVIAPITFAIGTIPGNEHHTLNWFKKMAALMLSAPAMLLCLGLAYIVPLSMISSTGSTLFTDSEGLNLLTAVTFVGNYIFVIFFPLVTVGITLKALSIPKALETAFLGDQAKPPRRK